MAHQRTKELLEGIKEPKHCLREDMDRDLDAARDFVARLRNQVADWRNFVEGAMAKEEDQGIRQTMYGLKVTIAGMADSIEAAARAIAEATEQNREIERRAEELRVRIGA